MSTCGRQNNDPGRHPRPTSLNLGNAVKGMLADAVVGNTERETGQERVRQVPQETSAPGDKCPRRRTPPTSAACKDGKRVHEPGNAGASQG